MSGGHYDYQYSRINTLADEIKSEFDDYKQTIKKNDGFDIFQDATNTQKDFIMREIFDLIKDLNRISNRAKNLEWFMSNDISIDNYINKIIDSNNLDN